jgi:hypothetical protein
MLRHLLILTLFVALPTFAKTLVFSSPKANANDYRAFVLSSAKYEFPSSYLAGLQEGPRHKKLADLFARAQLSFTEKSLVQAEDDFRDVIALTKTGQWSAEEQSILLHSYLRLAQLEKDPRVSDELFTEAITSLRVHKVDASFFPPPLVERFEKLLKKQTQIEVTLQSLAPDFQIAIINGEPIDIEKNPIVKLPEANILLTLLSDTYKTQQMEVDAKKIPETPVRREPWVSGTCHAPKIHFAESNIPTKAFYSLSCLTPLSAKEIPVASLPPAPVDAPAGIPLNQNVHEPDKKTSLFGNKWFWIGVGAVAVTAATIAITSQSRSSGSPTPTVSQGF